MYIICSYTSPRLEYVIDYLSDLWRTNIELISSAEEVKVDSAPMISYGERAAENILCIYDSGFLSQNTISDIYISEIVGQAESTKIFNKSDGIKDISFDIFSSIFIVLSRYEEYLPQKRDEYNRLASSESWLNKYSCLDIPIVDIWVNELRNAILLKFPNSKLFEHKFSVQPTIDIDEMWAYKYQRLSRNILGFVKNILKLDFNRLWDRSLVWLGSKDPFDSIDQLQNLFRGFDSVFFILVLSELPLRHKNSLKPKPSRSKVLALSKDSKVGLHPSLESNKDVSILINERDLLSENLDQDITLSRQHFLSFTLPNTYARLEEVGLTMDFSMGFHDDIGFRAGTSRPFKFYNLGKEESTGLTINPFQVMDVTLKKYLKLSPDDAIKRVQHIQNEIKKTGGTFSFIWHNSSFYELDGWSGWDKVLEECLKPS